MKKTTELGIPPFGGSQEWRENVGLNGGSDEISGDGGSAGIGDGGSVLIGGWQEI